MTTEEKKTIEIDDDITNIEIDDDITTVVRGGVRVTFNDNGGVSVHGDVPVTLHPPANDSGGAFHCGDRMKDGTIYAGISPDTGSKMFVMPQGAPGAVTPDDTPAALRMFGTPKAVMGTLRWDEAMSYAADLDAHGHKDWRLPTKAELHVLYRNRHTGALKGTFDEDGSYPAGWYWSSTGVSLMPDSAQAERFSDGEQNWDWKSGRAAVRPVRSEPRP
ncbi:MAG: DUF1566 domain-containing protein [Pseudorhodoplanes sp.]|nr:MAG: DUF1566 domain-containing protein [Pseudorhodoplanes sp.]MBZ0139494.1 DUF1566 domain-containing protein [Pseudorhodoplanes sp.]